jgi:hypothetical protein
MNKLEPITVDIVDSVIRCLSQRCHRETIAQRLFPSTDDSYASSWYNLDAFSFWCRLDLDNRQRAVELCIETYAD